MATFQHVPTEIAVEIFSYLEYLTLIKLSLTCRFFNSIIATATHGPLGVTLFRAKGNTLTMRDTLRESSHDDASFSSSTAKQSGELDGDISQEGKPATNEEEYCYLLHPCLLKLTVDFRESSYGDGRQIVDYFGFFHQTTGDFTPLSKHTLLPNERAFSIGIPAHKFFRQHKSPCRIPFLITYAIGAEAITVSEFVAHFAENFESMRERYHFDILRPSRKYNVGMVSNLQFMATKYDKLALYGRRLPNGIMSRNSNENRLGQIVTMF